MGRDLLEDIHLDGNICDYSPTLRLQKIRSLGGPPQTFLDCADNAELSQENPLEKCQNKYNDACKIYELFGNVAKSMFTLFTVMTLEGWTEIAEVIVNSRPYGGPEYAVFLILFIMIVNITLLNLVTGIIVENVLTISRQ